MPPRTSTSHHVLRLSDPGQHLTDINRILIGVSPDTSSVNYNKSTRLQRDPRIAVYLNIGRHNVNIVPGSGSSDGLRRFPNEAKETPELFATPETAPRLAYEIYKKLLLSLLKKEEEPNIALGLSELGLNSLVAVELRTWFKHVFAVDFSVLELLAMGTLEV